MLWGGIHQVHPVIGVGMRALGSGPYDLHTPAADIRQRTWLVSNERVTPQCPANQFLSYLFHTLSMKQRLAEGYDFVYLR